MRGFPYLRDLGELSQLDVKIFFGQEVEPLGRDFMVTHHVDEDSVVSDIAASHYQLHHYYKAKEEENIKEEEMLKEVVFREAADVVKENTGVQLVIYKIGAKTRNYHLGLFIGRLSAKTLNILGNPERVSVLVDKEKHLIAIKKSSFGFKITYDHKKKDGCGTFSLSPAITELDKKITGKFKGRFKEVDSLVVFELE